MALKDLINTKEPFLPHLEEWISKAKNKVVVLPKDSVRADEALLRTSVTTRSAMGCIIYETGGVLIDHNWIRILGSGCQQLNRSLPEWNKGKSFIHYGEVPAFLLIADDAIGGFYALNGGFFGEDKGNIYYFSPDVMEWMPLNIGYTDFLLFCFDTDMDRFYDGLRWEGWKEEVDKMSSDKAYSFVPMLWTEEAADINKVSRRAVPIEELFEINIGNK